MRGHPWLMHRQEEYKQQGFIVLGLAMD